MNDAVRSMLRAYGPLKNQTDEINALREIVQRVTLLGLHRGGFFEKASFYGGTALRILYNLDRFSEDMDFCLNSPSPNFQLSPYFESISEELARFGLDATLEEKRSGPKVSIESAFVKQDTIRGLLVIGGNNSRIPKGQMVKVRLEVDKSNPTGSRSCKKLVTLPLPFMVGTLTEESLFAGKIHAILARSYLNRVKGRDYYDFLFYSARGTTINLEYLEAKLRDSGHYSGNRKLTIDAVVSMLQQKFSSVDFEKARNDVRPFLKPEKIRDLNEWSVELFSALAEKVLAEPPEIR
jgi:predicted nucleotidyltransferase component of viral defense system